jgi:hypothetical protein
VQGREADDFPHRERDSSGQGQESRPTVPGMMRILGIGLTWKRLAALRKEASDLHKVVPSVKLLDKCFTPEI